MDKSLQQLQDQILYLQLKIKDTEELLRQSKNSDQRNAAKLEQSSKIFQTIVEHSPIPMAVASADGKLIAMNNIAIDQLGNPDVYIGMPLVDMKGMWENFDNEGDSIPLEELPLQCSLKGQVTKDKEINVVRKDGVTLWQMTNSNPVYDDNGQIIAAFIAFPDITEKKSAELKLETEKTRYRNIFENINISIWDEDISEVFDYLENLREEGIEDLTQYLNQNPTVIPELASKVKINAVNEATLNLFEVDARENFFEYIVEFFSEDTLKVFTKGLYSIWDKKPYFREKANYISAKGNEIKTIISFIIPSKREDFKNIPVTVLDVTELNYQQDRLNAVIDTLPDITFIFDEDGRYLEILTTKSDLLYADLVELKGCLISDILPKEKADIYLNIIQKTINTNKKQIFEYQLDVPNGKVWFEARVAPMQNTIKNKSAVVWLAVDITEKKKMKEQLLQAQKMEAIGILTGGIAHEFNNLLSPILGYTELLLNNKTEDDLDYKGLNQIFISSNRARKLVQQLLAYGRQSMSQKVLLSIDKIIDEAIKVIETTLPPDISIKKSLVPYLPLISGMPAEIHQSIINLCHNAITAMEDGGTLSFVLEEKAPEHGYSPRNIEYLCLSISDNGIGMDQFNRDRVFDPFFTTKKMGEGSGLGLSVVEGIIEQHNGQIEIVTELNKGSTFSLYFPTAASDNKQTETLIENNSENERILLVDDEQSVLDILKSMLEMLNYSVSTYTDTEQALKVVTEQPSYFDLAIIDYGMPKVSGKELAKQLKTLSPEMLLVLCTGFGEVIAKENIQDWGMEAVILKPFSINDVSQVVRSVLGNKLLLYRK